jgi:hypothetical protein
MTPLLNWLILFAFAGAAIYVARWVIDQAVQRWTGPRSAFHFAFLYLMMLATIAGLSFVVASVIYYEILYQGAFMVLVGLSGAVKFLLIFAGLWYGALYALKRRDTFTAGGGPKP